MTKKSPSTINKAAPGVLIALLLAVWQGLSSLGVVPKYMLPSPADVVKAFFADFPLLVSHSKTTLAEAALGLSCAIFLAFVVAFFMDRYSLLRRAVYPLLVVSQTVPTVAIAPLLILWLGYGIAPKVVLIVITCFFPMAIGLLEGFSSADPDTINLMRAMGSTQNQIFRYVKFPSSLKIAASYSVVGAVISEWLGGMEGLGVYMTRVKKSYSFDKMFAVIFLISAISLLLMKAIDLLQKKATPWDNLRQQEQEL